MLLTIYTPYTYQTMSTACLHFLLCGVVVYIGYSVQCILYNVYCVYGVQGISYIIYCVYAVQGILYIVYMGYRVQGEYTTLYQRRWGLRPPLRHTAALQTLRYIYIQKYTLKPEGNTNTKSFLQRIFCSNKIIRDEGRHQSLTSQRELPL